PAAGGRTGRGGAGVNWNPRSFSTEGLPRRSERDGQRQDRDDYRRQLRAGGRPFGGAGAGGLLGDLVRPLQDGRADARHPRRRARRQGPGRQAERGRQPQPGDQVPGPEHPHLHPVQGRPGGRAQARRAAQDRVPEPRRSARGDRLTERPGGREILSAGLADLGACALVIAGSSATDPDLAPFLSGAHLRDSFVVAPAEGPPRLGFFSPMERGEAAATGLPLLSPGDLDVERWVQEGADLPRFWAEVLAKAFALCGLSGRLAIAGHAPVGVIHAACEELSRRGFSFANGNALARRLRQGKTAGELAEIRRAADGTAAAFRRVAELLAAAEVRDGDLHLEGEPLRVARLRREVGRAIAERGLEHADLLRRPAARSPGRRARRGARSARGGPRLRPAGHSRLDAPGADLRSPRRA